MGPIVNPERLFLNCPECREENVVVPGMTFHAIGQVAPACTVQGVCRACRKEVYIRTTLLELPEELMPVSGLVASDEKMH